MTDYDHGYSDGYQQARADIADSGITNDNLRYELRECASELSLRTAECAALKAELASSRVGFTKVSPYEPGSRGRFSI